MNDRGNEYVPHASTSEIHSEHAPTKYPTILKDVQGTAEVERSELLAQKERLVSDINRIIELALKNYYLAIDNIHPDQNIVQKSLDELVRAMDETHQSIEKVQQQITLLKNQQQFLHEIEDLDIGSSYFFTQFLKVMEKHDESVQHTFSLAQKARTAFEQYETLYKSYTRHIKEKKVQEMRGIETKFFGLGKYLYRTKLQNISRSENEKEKMYKHLIACDSQIQHDTYFRDYNSKIEFIQQGIAEKLAKGIRAYIDSELTNNGLTLEKDMPDDETTHQPRLSSQAIDSLYDSCIVRLVEEPLNQKIHEAKERGEEKFAQELAESMDEIKQCAREIFFYPLSSFYPSHAISNDMWEAIDAAKAKVSALRTSYPQSGWYAESLLTSLYSKKSYKGIFEEMARMAQRKANEMQSEYVVKEALALCAPIKGARLYGDEINKIRYEYPSKLQELQNSLAVEDIASLDIKKWHIFFENSHVRQEMGEGTLLHAEDVLADNCIKLILTSEFRTQKSIGAGYSLFELNHQLKNVPFMVLNSFREPGYSGEMPFISVHSNGVDMLLYKYISNLNDDQINALREMNIPGFMDLIHLIKTYPDEINRSCFYDTQTGESIKNEHYYAMRSHLKDIALYLFARGDDEMKKYLLPVFDRCEGDMSDVYAVFKKEVSKKEPKESTQELKERIIQTILDHIRHTFNTQDVSALFNILNTAPSPLVNKTITRLANEPNWFQTKFNKAFAGRRKKIPEFEQWRDENLAIGKSIREPQEYIDEYTEALRITDTGLIQLIKRTDLTVDARFKCIVIAAEEKVLLNAEDGKVVVLFIKEHAMDIHTKYPQEMTKLLYTLYTHYEYNECRELLFSPLPILEPKMRKASIEAMRDIVVEIQDSAARAASQKFLNEAFAVLLARNEQSACIGELLYMLTDLIKIRIRYYNTDTTQQTYLKNMQEKIQRCVCEYLESDESMESDPVLLYYILQILTQLNAASPEYIPQFYELRQHKEPISQYCGFEVDIDRDFILLLVSLDPNLGKLLYNPLKLGALRERVLDQLVTFIKNESENEKNHETFVNNTVLKLEQLRYTYESSDSSLVDKRCLFLENYSMNDSHDPLFRQEVQKITEGGMTEQAALAAIVRRDFETILIQSGCSEQKRFYQSRLRELQDKKVLTHEEEVEKTSLEEKVTAMERALEHADARNRALYTACIQKLQESGLQKEPFVELVVPKNTSVSQVGPGSVTLPILHEGTLCDALLGAAANRQEENLSVHIAKTSRIVEPSGHDFALRLPSYGNPHGITVNRVYGDVTHFDHKPYGQDSSADTSFMMGTAHQCVYLGIPSTEITAMVIDTKQEDIAAQKQAVATKGFFIPLLDAQTHALVWGPEEFDEMKTFYHHLSQEGYTQDTIHTAYEYYKAPVGSPCITGVVKSAKHQCVLEKAIEYNTRAADDKKIDLVVLVDYLQNNELNGKPLTWYQEQGFDEIHRSINRHRVRFVLHGIREQLYDYSRYPNQKMPIEEAKKMERIPNQFIDSFFGHELPYIGVEPGTDRYKQYENALKDLLFGKARSSKRIQEIAELFSSARKELMQKLWRDVIENPKIKSEFEPYKDLLIPVITGSSGRHEIAFGSDLDYLIIFNDSQWHGEENNTALQESKEKAAAFVNVYIAPQINALLHNAHIRADAGLARAKKEPFTSLSNIKKFTIELHTKRQEEEPTEIMDMEPLFTQHATVVGAAKDLLINQNKTAYLLDSFIQRDLYGNTTPQGEQRNSYVEKFNELYNDLANGQTLEHIKESLQRIIHFKIYYLLFNAFEKKVIPKENAQKLPSQTMAKLDILHMYGVLDSTETAVCKELISLIYRVRFLGEIFAGETQEQEIKKVKNVAFEQKYFNFDERKKLFSLLRFFREEILYK